VISEVGGTQTGSLSMPGMPTVPPTGKKVSVMDTYILTVQGDKVSHITGRFAADGGIQGLLRNWASKCRPCRLVTSNSTPPPAGF